MKLLRERPATGAEIRDHPLRTHPYEPPTDPLPTSYSNGERPPTKGVVIIRLRYEYEYGYTALEVASSEPYSTRTRYE
eukprot:scaffold669484_cov34-Prasinocladus_malaysianus.AAC.1